MEIIVTHDMADFDGVASAVLAQRLHPGATIVLGRRLSPGVREFMALHKDRFSYRRHPDVDTAEITRLIAVDVRRAGRLADFSEVLDRLREPGHEIQVHVWDHHAAAADDLPGDVVHVEPVGATVTLLVEEIRRRGERLDPAEATLCALAIHSDTGSLTYPTTSPRDAEALAWLLGLGANLKLLQRYLKQAFSLAQREVLARLLGGVELEWIGGVGVGFAIIPMEHAVDGLADVTTEAIDLLGHPALFAIFPVGSRRVQVVARARAGCVDVGAALEALGGGGHRAAASAILKEGDPEGVRRRILEALRADPPRPRVVAELMSSPVRTVRPELSLSLLADSLTTWHHTGVPVVSDQGLVGIVSRRDVRSAERDGRLHLPVSSCMTHRVRTTTPETTLDEALATMVEGDVGRLPVLRGEHLVGILSRTDVLRVLYGGDSDGPPHPGGS